MKICLEGAGRRYNRQQLFSDITHTIEAGKPCAVLGRNGSGKSTLLRIIAGLQKPTSGTVLFVKNKEEPRLPMYQEVALCAPGMELPEEMTLLEFLKFHSSLKPWKQGLATLSVLEETGLGNSKNMQIADFSSGMKQRVKLAQAFFSQSPVLLLDEPCSNLDHTGVAQYEDWCSRYTKGRIVVVASNDAREHLFCRDAIQL